MSLPMLMDEHVKSAITDALRARGVDVLTTQEDGSDGLTDDDLLDRATALGRILFTSDKDFLSIAAVRQTAGHAFFGVVFARQAAVPIAKCIDDLFLLCELGEAADVENKVIHITAN